MSLFLLIMGILFPPRCAVYKPKYIKHKNVFKKFNFHHLTHQLISFYQFPSRHYLHKFLYRCNPCIDKIYISFFTFILSFLCDYI